MNGVKRYAAAKSAKNHKDNPEAAADQEHAGDGERVLESLGPAAVTLLYYLPEIEEVLNESDLSDMSMSGEPSVEMLLGVSSVLDEMPIDVISMIEEFRETDLDTISRLSDELASKAHTEHGDRLAAFLFLGSRLPRIDFGGEIEQA